MKHMANYMGKFKDCSLEYHSEDERSLIAIQGPKAQYAVE
jgi:glycine cleavage system aminomethyltransferase T